MARQLAGHLFLRASGRAQAMDPCVEVRVFSDPDRDAGPRDVMQVARCAGLSGKSGWCSAARMDLGTTCGLLTFFVCWMAAAEVFCGAGFAAGFSRSRSGRGVDAKR